MSKATVVVTNTDTGEIKEYKNATMMVASNGVIFVKQGSVTVFASGSTSIIVEVK